MIEAWSAEPLPELPAGTVEPLYDLRHLSAAPVLFAVYGRAYVGELPAFGR